MPIHTVSARAGQSRDDRFTSPAAGRLGRLTVEQQAAEPDSTLSLYCRALRLRHEVPGLQTEEFRWRDSADGVLDFERGADFRCVLNLSGAPVPLDDGWTVLVAIGKLTDPADDAADDAADRAFLPHDTAVWLARNRP